MLRRVFQLCLWWGTLGIATVTQAATIEEALATHAETLAGIKSMQLRITLGTQQPDGKVRLMSQTDIWRSGTAERSIKRTLSSVTPKGMQDVPQPEQVTMVSYDDREIRTLRGWDPEAPYPLPLDETRSAREFGAVKGTITPRDPTGGTLGEWSTLLLEIYPGKSLAEIAKTSQFKRLDDSTEKLLRIKIVASDVEPLQDAEIDLDLTRGALVSKVIFGKTKAVAEVTRFHDLGEGRSLPAEVRRTHGPVSTITTCADPRVNESMAPELLTVTFPPGARVDDAATGQVFLWGKDGPAETFGDAAKFAEHQQARMRESQQAPLLAARSQEDTSWILWVNLLGIAGLLALMFVRRKWVNR